MMVDPSVVRREQEDEERSQQPMSDEQIVEWLGTKLLELRLEDANERARARTVLVRFRDLVECEDTLRRGLAAIEGAHKIVMAQLRFAECVVKQLGRREESPF